MAVERRNLPGLWRTALRRARETIGSQPREEVVQQPPIRPETVDALLAQVWKLLDDDRDREGSINLRGVAVAGFAGVVVGLSATLAKDALSPDLPGGWRYSSFALFAVGVLLLAGVIVYTLLAMLLPRDRPTLGVQEVERYPTWEAVCRPVEIEQGRAMNGLVTSLTETRSLTDTKARALRNAYWGLTVGLILVSALALIPGLRYAGIIELHHHV
jgi:hypothetical protein